MTRNQKDSLWEKAPAWRGLTVTASFLTLAAFALPVLLSQPEQAPQPAPVRAQAAPMRVAVAPQPVTVAPPPAILTLPPRVSAPPAHAPTAIPPVRAAAIPVPAIVVPQTAPASGAPVCGLRQSATAPVLIGLGTVTGFEDHALSMARIEMTEAQSGGKIDPDYIDNQRVIVQRPNGQNTVFILPKNLQVHIGDRVTLQNGYRNMALPCNYVPIQIASDIGPAPAAALSGEAATTSQQN